MCDEDFIFCAADNDEVTEKPFEVLTSAQVNEMMKQEVTKVKNVIDVSSKIDKIVVNVSMTRQFRRFRML